LREDGTQRTRIIALGTSTFNSAPLFCRNEDGQMTKAQVIKVGGPAQVNFNLISTFLKTFSVLGGAISLTASLVNHLRILLCLEQETKQYRLAFQLGVF
jgi:hypothetical protein